MRLEVYRGATIKEVAVTDVPASTSDDEILECAMRVAHEDRSSLFGWSVTRVGDGAVVRLDTD